MDNAALAPRREGMKDIYIGRQAIFDREMAVFAYELLFRTGPHPSSQVVQSCNGDSASSEVLLNTFMEIGLEQVAGPHRVFINLTRKLFLDHPGLPFERDRVVLELLEDIPVDAALLESVERLSRQGYQLALDDYCFDLAHQPLLPWMHIVKVEVPALPLAEIARRLPDLRRHGVKLLAEKIESEQEYRQLREMGFDYFQGYYFSRPKVLAGKRLEENQLVLLRLLSALNDPEVTLEALEGIISQDASFSYKILRYMNSAAAGMPRRVDSIRQAVLYMGLKRIRAWASLLALAGQRGDTQAHFVTALVRANMCEQLVTEAGGCPPEKGFSVGLLSILDLLLGRPLAEILGELALSDEIRSALLWRQGVAGRALHCALAYERQEWTDAWFEGVTDAQITRIYLRASERAFASEQSLLGD